jgi:hypothetical protein
MFGRRTVLLCAAAAFLAASVAAHATPIMISIPIPSTGQDVGGQDNNYIYVMQNDPTINPGVLPSGASHAYIMNQYAWPIDPDSGGTYFTLYPGAGWIGPQPQYTSSGYITAPPNKYFIYQTSFTIPNNADPNKVLIWGDMASDNCTFSIGINGTAVTMQPGSPALMSTTSSTCMTEGHEFEISGGHVGFGDPFGTDPVYLASGVFHKGVNTIQFEVYNNNDPPPNPTGLVVWLQADAMPTPEAGTVGLVLAGLAAVVWLRRRSSRPPA